MSVMFSTGRHSRDTFGRFGYRERSAHCRRASRQRLYLDAAIWRMSDPPARQGQGDGNQPMLAIQERPTFGKYLIDAVAKSTALSALDLPCRLTAIVPPARKALQKIQAAAVRTAAES